ARRRGGMDERDASDGIRSPSAAGTLSRVPGGLSDAAPCRPRRPAPLLFSVQANFMLGAIMIGRNGVSEGRMLKGTRDAVLQKIQPISIHGQISWEIVFTHLD